MFENLSERLGRTLRHITGKSKLSEVNIQESLQEVRDSLLEADVALQVVDAFISTIKTKALGQQVSDKLSPSQYFIKLVNDELVELMGKANESLNLQATPPVVILVAGLQGSGKTTSCAKLAKYLQTQQKKSVMLVSCDIYRPAAIQQLEIVATEVGASFYPSNAQQKPVDIVKQALDAAKKSYKDVLIVDTAGRLHIDSEMMAEVQQIHRACMPTETLFVVDSMTGQDAANTAKAFNEALPLTGVILTKTDGDARGGAKKRPFYHVVAADKRRARNSKYLERLGYFNPIAKGQETELLLVRERIAYWVSVGAQLSDKVQILVNEWDTKAGVAA